MLIFVILSQCNGNNCLRNAGYIFSDIELDRIFILADNIAMTKSQPNSYIQLEYPMVLRLMYGCGLRIGETLVLKMKDVDLDNGVLTLRHQRRQTTPCADAYIPGFNSSKLLHGNGINRKNRFILVPEYLFGHSYVNKNCVP